MLVIKIELWPWGIEAKARTLATGYIINDASGTATRGNYTIILKDKAGRTWKDGRVIGFARKRWLAWDLLYLGLRNLLESRHGREHTTSTDHQGPEAAGCDCGGEHGVSGDAGHQSQDGLD